MRVLPHHYESSAIVRGTAEEVFDYVDDHTLLASHMRKSSWAMGGGSMQIEMDGDRGRAVASCISISGRVFGIRLAVDEVVTERVVARRKVWETIGRPRLLVIGDYRMGFDITSRDQMAVLRVFIDYTWPEDVPGRWLARMFAPSYARWCTRRMVGDAVAHFALPAAPSKLVRSEF